MELKWLEDLLVGFISQVVRGSTVQKHKARE